MVEETKKFFKGIYADETGAMAVEKVLLLAIIAIPIVYVLYKFKDKILGWFEKQEQQIDQG